MLRRPSLLRTPLAKVGQALPPANRPKADDLILTKDFAVLGAADCDNQYLAGHTIMPTTLRLRPSPNASAADLGGL